MGKLRFREAGDATPANDWTPEPWDGAGVPTASFVTKDSGVREEFDTGMQRDTQSGKPRFDLVMPLGQPFNEQMLTRWAGLMARGAEKYDDRNWEQAATQVELDRYLSSAFRHFVQYLAGEQDEDHAAAVFFNIAGAEYVKWRMRNDG